jgi:hypothetical protein
MPNEGMTHFKEKDPERIQSRADINEISNQTARAVELNYHADISSVLGKTRTMISEIESLELEYLDVFYEPDRMEFVMLGVFRFAGYPIFAEAHNSDLHYSDKIMEDFMFTVHQFIVKRVSAIESVYGYLKYYGISPSNTLKVNDTELYVQGNQPQVHEVRAFNINVPVNDVGQDDVADEHILQERRIARIEAGRAVEREQHLEAVDNAPRPPERFHNVHIPPQPAPPVI